MSGFRGLTFEKSLKAFSTDLPGENQMNNKYDKLYDGPMDEIDAAIWSGDTFHNRANIADFRELMARWEKGLKEAEDILKAGE